MRARDGMTFHTKLPKRTANLTKMKLSYHNIAMGAGVVR